MTDKKPKLCLIDASGYIHRAYHALPPLSTSKGEPVNAVFGFSRMISKVLKNERPDYIAVCFDTPKPTFRHEQYVDYKAHRVESDSALILQLPLSEELARVWGLPCMKLDGYEADDVIATLALHGKKAGWDVLIMTGDKDILQLVDEDIRVRDEIRNVDYNTEKVQEKYGLTPHQLVDYFCLLGDKVDNVKGVPGVGDVTATKLLSEYGTLERLFENTEHLKPALKEKLEASKDIAFGNRSLIRLKSDVPLNVNDNDLKVKKPDESMLSELLTRLEFRGELFGVSNTAVLSSTATVNETRRVNVVLTDSDLASLKGALSSATQLAYDLETDSLDDHHCNIVGVALSVKEGEGWYIPVGHSYLGAPPQLPWEKVKETLLPIMQNESVEKIGQNLKFDDTILSRYGVEARGAIFDTMVAAYCLEPARSGFGLKDLARDFLNERMTRIDELLGNEKDKTMVEVPIDKAAPYAGADAEVTLRLAALFRKRLKDEKLEPLFNNLEMPLVRVIREMEKAGVAVDVDFLRTTGKKFEGMKHALEKEIFELAGEPFVINSPKQMARILFEKLKMPPGKKTKTGYSTNEEVLSRLAKEYPICEKILSYREIAKLISTYVDSILTLVDEKTKRVHTSFHQTGTITGRLSSTEPNLQNIPVRTEIGREIRRAFVAPSGRVLLSADYSQIDLRALAHLSEDPVLIDTFNRGGDIHAATAAEIFHVSASDVTAEMRRRAKAINFGIVYGQQAWGLSQGLDIPREEAQSFITKYFERYAGVRGWIESTLSEVRKTGVVTTMAGRRRKINDIDSENSSARGFAERIAINTPIQGSSADIIKVAMIRVSEKLKQEKFATLMMVQVHDELLFEVPERELSDIMTMVKQEMEAAYQLKVPLVVDLKVGVNWNDMEKRKLAVAA
jgi:DNA polymerase I